MSYYVKTVISFKRKDEDSSISKLVV